jgi:hypothetical protein
MYTLDIEEKDYFGLQFMDHYHVQVNIVFYCYKRRKVQHFLSFITIIVNLEAHLLVYTRFSALINRGRCGVISYYCMVVYVIS